MLALLSKLAHERHHDRFEDLRRLVDVELVLLGADGSLTDSAATPVTDPDVEVAFLSSDLFFGDQLERFFALLEASPELRWVQSAAAGTDIPGFAELMARGVRICNAHVTSVPIAEFVLRAVLDHFQDAGAWREAQARREWAHHDFREIDGSTWCIVGLGSIGTEVARRARAFGAHVTGVRRTPRGDEPADTVVTPDGVFDLIPHADVVVVAAPSTADTAHLVDASFLEALQPHAVLVNVARGGLVDEAALVAALDAGRPEVAILDVFDTEPLPGDSPLWDHPRVVVTPHTSGAGRRRWDRAAALFCDNLVRLVSLEPLVHEIARLDQGTTSLSHVGSRPGSTPTPPAAPPPPAHQEGTP